MQTRQLYYLDPYKKECESLVLSAKQKGNLVNVILDKTIFHPEGGGQPSDRGKLGNTQVEYVRFSNGEIIHQVKGDLVTGQKLKCVLDWDWRYKYMKIHTAGHLIHDVLMSMVPGLTPLSGGHGKKPFIEYQGHLDPSKKEEIEIEVNKMRERGLTVVTKEVRYEELQKECQFIPDTLPKNKPLRMIKIGQYAGMPDGGVQVANTKEIGIIWIANILYHEGKTILRYGVVGS